MWFMCDVARWGGLYVMLLGEVMVCVLDFKRDVGLWHGILTVSHSLAWLLQRYVTLCDSKL